MRQIKFRAWDKANSKYYEPTYRAYAGQLEDLLINFNGDLTMRTLEDPAIHESLFPNRFVLQQYTGLKDKNGREIYEGDIVDIGIPLDRTRRNFVGEISYCTEFACFRVDHPNIILISEYDGIEVIGNIYNNPELLEVE